MSSKMMEIADACVKEMKVNKNMTFTQKDKNDFYNATHCHICKEEFHAGCKEMKVRDHCHRTGCYRGAAHNKCNINFFPIDMFQLCFTI